MKDSIIQAGLVVHPLTQAQLYNFAAKPVHAVLLIGPDGIGKTALAEALICNLLELPPAALRSYPQFAGVTPTNSTISIDAIRELQKFLQLKTIGNRPLRRAVLIEHAQELTIEAQNAYLKLLEEPPADTIMVLTVSTPRALLPTIMSRVQSITVHTPTEAQAQPLFKASAKDPAILQQAYYLSGGLPGLFAALVSGDETHPLLASVADAKAILQKTPFERLAMVDGLSKQKANALLIVEALSRIADTMIASAAQKSDATRLRQWHHIRTETLHTSEALAQSANAKLALSNLFLHL